MKRFDDMVKYLKEGRAFLDAYAKGIGRALRKVKPPEWATRIAKVEQLDTLQEGKKGAKLQMTQRLRDALGAAMAEAQSIASVARAYFRRTGSAALADVPVLSHPATLPAKLTYVRRVRDLVKGSADIPGVDRNALKAELIALEQAHQGHAVTRRASVPVTKELRGVLRETVSHIAVWVNLFVAVARLAGMTDVVEQAPRQPQGDVRKPKPPPASAAAA